MPNLLEIIHYDDDVLRKISEPVKSLTPELKSFIDDLTHTMYEKDGVGLAAPQVGVSKRIFVCDPDYSKTNVKKPIVIINPEILEYDGEKNGEEGCLSVPNIFEKVKRFERVKIQYRDLKWKLKILDTTDLMSVIIQHENDHLNGVLFIDKLTTLRKMSIGLKLSKLAERTRRKKSNHNDEL